MRDIPKFEQMSTLPIRNDNALTGSNELTFARNISIVSMKVLEVTPVCELLSCSRVTLWRIRQSDPTFPLPISLGDKKSIRFIEFEIHEWLRKKMHARTSSSTMSQPGV